MLEREVVVLTDQRKHQRHDIALERHSRNDPFVKRLFRSQQHVDRELEPGAFRTLARMVKAGQFGGLELSADTRIGDKWHEPDAFDAARVFSGKTFEGVLDLLQRAFRQGTLVLVLNAYRHRSQSL